MANRENYDSDVKIAGTSSADKIYNHGGNNVSISAGAGNDSVTVEGGHNVTVSGGAGNDYVQHDWGAGTVYIYSGGNDTIEGFNEMDNLVIANANWTSQRVNDLTVVINVDGKGTVTLINESLIWGSKINIVSSMKNIKRYNSIGNDQDGKTIKGTAANNDINNAGNNVLINAGNGFNCVWNGEWHGDEEGTSRGHYSTIISGKNDDVIWNSADYVSINTGDGDDAIDNIHAKTSVTINTGAGNDSIINFAAKSSVIGGKGNDYISNCIDSRGYWGDGSKVTIDAGTGNDTIDNNGNNVTIDAGDGDDLIDGNGGSNVKIFGGKGADTIYSWYSGKNVTIDSGKGDDYIHNDSPNSSILAGSGNDNIRNYAENTFVDAGSGNDYMYMNEHMDWNDETQIWDYVRSPDNVTINAGSGDDTIINNIYGYKAGENVSINGGSGNDVIENSGFNATILGGKGNDTVYNSEAGMVYVYKPGEGNDFISGFGTLETLVVDGAKFTTVKSGSDVLVKVAENTITLAGAASLAKVNIAKSTKGIAPVNVVENSTEKKKIKGKASSNWIRNYADKVTINGGASTDDIYNSGSNVKIKGGGGYDQIRSYASDVSIQGGAQADKIISGNGDNVSIDAGKGNDVIDVYQGVNLFVRGGKGNDTVNLNNALGWNGRYIFSYAKGDGKDVISKGAIINLIDGATIAQTLTSGSDTVLKIDSGSVTVKDTKPEEIVVVKNNKYSAYLVDVLNNKAQGKVIGKSSATATQKIRNYGEASTIIGGKGIDSIYNEASNSSINAGAGDDYLATGDYNISGVTALGGAGNDSIYNNGKNASIDGGAGNDTIISESGSENVTIDGGKGHDVIEVQGLDYVVRGGKGNDFIYLQNDANTIIKYSSGDGNDTIYGFGKTSTLQIGNGKGTYSTVVSNSDIIVTVGKGKVTLDGAVDLPTLNINGMDIMRLTLNNKSAAKVTLDSAIKTADASARTKTIKITGNKFANTISGSSKNDSLYGAKGNDSIFGNAGNDILYGQKGNDTLWGGAGNDSLYGGDGKDTFIYKPGEGTDTIFDYTSGDILQILKSNGKSGGSFTKSAFSGDTLTLTINGGGTVLFDGVAKGDKFNINGTSYKISGSKLK